MRRYLRGLKSYYYRTHLWFILINEASRLTSSWSRTNAASGYAHHTRIMDNTNVHTLPYRVSDLFGTHRIENRRRENKRGESVSNATRTHNGRPRSVRHSWVRVIQIFYLSDVPQKGKVSKLSWVCLKRLSTRWSGSICRCKVQFSGFYESVLRGWIRRSPCAWLYPMIYSNLY